jgi:hypothetical protein
MKLYSNMWEVETPCERYKFRFDPKTKIIKWITDHIPEYQKEQHEKRFLGNL